jgi:hypothetical protein
MEKLLNPSFWNWFHKLLREGRGFSRADQTANHMGFSP